MAEPSKQGLEKLTRILLAIVCVTIPVSLGLAGYVVFRTVEIEELRAQLLSESDLQSRLLGAQSSDHAVIPHIDREIGYVLNKSMKSATWHGVEGKPYRVNSIGLRGEDIGPKPPGVTRIVLAGDSVLFGWKLEDPDIVANIMQRIVGERLAHEEIEFVNVALPGWNIRSERAFLDRHLDLLQPDHVIWSLIRNDIFTSPGVVPPGILEASTTSQKRAQVPLSGSGAFFHRDLPIPTVVEAWRENVRLIKEFGERHEVGITLLYWRPRSRDLFDLAMREEGFAAPVVMLPDALRRDARFQFSAGDSHATAWGTERVAIGLLAQLMREGVIPDVAFEAHELEYVRAFEASSPIDLSSEAVAGRFADLTDLVPTRYVHAKTAKAALYGEFRGTVFANGLLVMRDPARSNALQLDLEVPDPGVTSSMHVDLRVRNRAGDEHRVVEALKPGAVSIRLPLPESGAGEVFEVAWKFDYAFCRNRWRCPAAVLQSATFVE
jgi:hypothetical protein